MLDKLARPKVFISLIAIRAAINYILTPLLIKYADKLQIDVGSDSLLILGLRIISTGMFIGAFYLALVYVGNRNNFKADQ